MKKNYPAIKERKVGEKTKRVLSHTFTFTIDADSDAGRGGGICVYVKSIHAMPGAWKLGVLARGIGR